MKIFIVSMLALSFIFFGMWGGIRIYNGIMFNLDCGGYIKNAADANTIELAKEQLCKALEYVEYHNLTSGNTGIIFHAPTNDVSFWYRNLKSAYVSLCQVPPNATELEKSNQLIKLRETLLDHDKDGDTITSPGGISIYPHNVIFCIWGLLSGAMLVVLCVVLYVELD
jgi:hypothetical protein